MAFDFAGIGTSLCECAQHRVQNILQTFADYGTQTLRQQARLANDLAQGYIDEVLDMSGITQLYNDTQSYYDNVMGQARRGLATPAGQAISQTAACLGVNINATLNDLFSLLDPGNFLMPFIDFLADLEGTLGRLLGDFDFYLDISLGLCGTAGSSAYMTQKDALLDVMGANSNGTFNIALFSSGLGFSSEYQSMFDGVTRMAGSVRMLAQNIQDLPSFDGPNILGFGEGE